MAGFLPVPFISRYRPLSKYQVPGTRPVSIGEIAP